MLTFFSLRDQKRFSASVPLLVGLALVSGCSTSEMGRHQMMLVPESRVERLSGKTFERIKFRNKIDNNPEENQYVQCIVSALSETIPDHPKWEVALFLSDQANAFALPGGKIGIYTGIFRVAINADQLATVIGHEIGHVIAQHGRERMSQQMTVNGLELTSNILARNASDRGAAGLASGASAIGQFGILYPFSRQQETEADLIGLRIMVQAGFDPKESVKFWKNMETYGIGETDEELTSHPPSRERIENLTLFMTQIAGHNGYAGKSMHCVTPE